MKSPLRILSDRLAQVHAQTLAEIHASRVP